MNDVILLLNRLYARLIRLYPAAFREEFGEEMSESFHEALEKAGAEGVPPLTRVCLREIVHFPASLLREFRYEFERKKINMTANENLETQPKADERTGHWDALVGAMPFALFGIASMIGKSMIPYLGIYTGLVFYVIVLLGLLIGLIKGVPRWTYSYLSWSLVFALWWSNMGTVGLKILGFQIDYWTWQIWPPLFVAIGVALIWTRSLHPLQQLVRGIWQDWTLASFTIYTLFASVLLGYDENRHPYLFLFMIASTVILSTSVWFFLRSIDTRKQVISLLSGFVLAFAVVYISDATWDWHAYYGYPKPPAEAGYMSVLRYVAFMVFYGIILFLPILLGVIRHSADEDRAA